MISLGIGDGRRSSSMQRLCAIRYSHARSEIGVELARSAACARTNTSCRTSSASAVEAAQHLPRVGEQAHPVAVVDRPEGVVGPGAEERDQLIVRT